MTNSYFIVTGIKAIKHWHCFKKGSGFDNYFRGCIYKLHNNNISIIVSVCRNIETGFMSCSVCKNTETGFVSCSVCRNTETRFASWSAGIPRENACLQECWDRIRFLPGKKTRNVFENLFVYWCNKENLIGHIRDGSTLRRSIYLNKISTNLFRPVSNKMPSCDKQATWRWCPWIGYRHSTTKVHISSNQRSHL